VVVARVGRLEGIGTRLDGEHQVHDLIELQVGEARAEVDAVAGVEADALLGKAALRMVEEFDALLHPAAVLREVHVLEAAGHTEKFSIECPGV
jgi:hypothetical protein